MKYREIINESIPRTLYHGTLRRLVPAIMNIGLEPNVGDFTKHAYDESINAGIELPELVFAADKQGLRKCISAIVGALRQDGIKYNADNLYRYGAIVVLKLGEEYFEHRDEDDENYYGEYPETVEPGDYYRRYGIKPDYFLTGERLRIFLKRNNAFTYIFEPKTIREILISSAKKENNLEMIDVIKNANNYELEQLYKNRNKFNESFNLLKSDVDGFMGELHKHMDEHENFWKTVYLHVLPERYDIGEIYIDSMGILNHDQNKNKGKGRTMVQTLTSLADKYHVRLKLSADESSVSKFLEDWYSRCGFEYSDEYSDYGPVMIRDPI